ncbi:XRE family transcriptional regulator [Actinomadura rubrisoli]|uniref:XRE family transcriptional regulator n=1 Tax=Actinomadura rubrisoli TaxID=2530368 RepID=A0A4R5C1G8_9ACTN|nr:XRE family transcriptional regulator [Actinomadura rubrisoli]
MRRRAAMKLITVASAGAAIPPGTLETTLSGIEEALGNPLDVAGWERLVTDYDHQLHTTPAGGLISDLTSDIVAMSEVFKRRLPPLQHAELLRVSAALSGLLAIEFCDSGDQRAARITWGIAIRAADTSGDQQMRVWTRGRAAQDAFFAGSSPVAVANLANEAEHIAGGTPSPGLAKACAARLSLAVQQRDNTKIHVALADLRRTCDQVPDSNIKQSVFGHRETQRLWEESYAYVHIGDKRAEGTLAQARALYPDNALAPLSNLKLMRAVSLIKARDVTTGLQLALDTLQTQKRSSAGGRMLAGSVLGALPLKARALPEAREIRALGFTAGA